MSTNIPFEDSSTSNFLTTTAASSAADNSSSSESNNDEINLVLNQSSSTSLLPQQLQQQPSEDLNPPNTFTPIKDDDDDDDDEYFTNHSNSNYSNHQQPESEENNGPSRQLEDNYHEDGNVEDDDEEFDINQLPNTVTILKTDVFGDESDEKPKTIYLVGTSHFSKSSHQDVRTVIQMVKPNVVVLELCRSRMCFISMDEKEIMKEAKSLDFNKILDYMKKNGFVQGFIYTLLLSASAKVTNDLDLAPGGEFRNAFNEAIKIPNCTVILGDRPIDITLRRAISRLTTWQKIKITFHCLFNNEKLNEEELERYKNRDVLDQLVDELSSEFPGLSEVMVDERDSFLTHSLWNASTAVPPGSNIVGVVGIGHTAGIKNKWPNAKNIDVSKLIQIPETKKSKTMLIIKYSFYGTIVYGLYRFVLPKSIKNWTFELGQQFFQKIVSLAK